jgi:hypothetical protein
MTQQEQIKSGLEILRAVADTIKELKQVPSGILYSQMMEHMELSTYDKIIGILKGAKLIREENHMLVWIGPGA